MREATFSQNLALTTMILLAVYYVVANIFCFYAYREFKGMMWDYNNGQMGGNFGMSGVMNRGRRAESEESLGGGGGQSQQAQQQSAFSGGGGRQIGGGGGGGNAQR